MNRLLAAVCAAVVALVVTSFVVRPTGAAFSSQVANVSTFSAAAAFPSTCDSYSLSWMTGMEHGMDTTAGGGVWSPGISSGAAVVDAAVKRSGGKSLRLDVAGAPVYRGRTLPPTATAV